MPLPPTYSRRKRQAEAKGDDVYVYDRIPGKLRVQVVQILRDGLGRYFYSRHVQSNTAYIYDYIYNSMCRELGVHVLGYDGVDNDEVFLSWLEKEENIDNWLDGLELALRCIDVAVGKDYDQLRHEAEFTARATPHEAISELNARMQEAGVGYEFTGGQIVRKDSEFIHKEVVVPTLQFLKSQRFAAADKEFREAHEAYRHGRLEDCIVSCGKALESVLKVIGASRNWPINDNDPASKLIQAAVNTGFLPSYSQAGLNHLHSLIKSSTPTVRNKVGGHGAGSAPRSVSRHLASFQLHQTAAVIIFLTEQDAQLVDEPIALQGTAPPRD